MQTYFHCAVTGALMLAICGTSMAGAQAVIVKEPVAQLTAFPDRVVRQVSATASYRYMVANADVLMIDPVTNTVVEEIIR